MLSNLVEEWTLQMKEQYYEWETWQQLAQVFYHLPHLLPGGNLGQREGRKEGLCLSLLGLLHLPAKVSQGQRREMRVYFPVSHLPAEVSQGQRLGRRVVLEFLFHHLHFPPLPPLRVTPDQKKQQTYLGRHQGTSLPCLDHPPLAPQQPHPLL